MAEVVLSTDELTVIGGPQSVQVALDFGPAGVRGSYIFAGNGNPNDVPSLSPNINDLYVNILSTSDEYSYLYQYQATPSGSVWNPLLKLNPTVYSVNLSGSFETVSGVGEKTFNLATVGIISQDNVGSLTASNFNVQYSVINENPVSASISVGTLDTELGVLPLTIKALEYSGGEWIPLNGSKSVHFLITIVV